MSTRALIKNGDVFPSLFDDFFRPWNEWFDNGGSGKTLRLPAVNIAENKDDFTVSLAVPGMKKDDFNIDVNGNMLTISCNKEEEEKEEKQERYTRKEYNYSSFSRSFTLPEEINKEKIDARYEDGVLRLALPKKEEAKKLTASKHVTVK